MLEPRSALALAIVVWLAAAAVVATIALIRRKERREVHV